jgi:hypothetical protein
MAFTNKPVFVFENEASTGLNTVPLNSLVGVKCSGKLYQYISTSGISSITTIGSIKDINLKEYVPITYGNALFYGGNSVGNTITVFDNNAVLVGTESTIGTARYYFMGANVGVNVLFYGGWSGSYALNIATILTKSRTLAQTENNVGGSRGNGASGANVGVNALFYGGYYGANAFLVNDVTILTPTATLAQTERALGTDRRGDFGGCNVGSSALFYGGFIINTTTLTNKLSILSNTATILLDNLFVGSSRVSLTGANASSICVFYGGCDVYNNPYNIIDLISQSGSLIQTESNVGTARSRLGGASIGSNALFYGGSTYSATNVTTLISSTATLVQAESNVGTPRYGLAGASI